LGRRRNAYLVGLKLAESEALLDELWSFVDRPEFAWEHVWRVGDLVLWDNRCTMHRREAFDPGSRRIMHRTQVKGELRPSCSADAIAIRAPPRRRAHHAATRFTRPGRRRAGGAVADIAARRRSIQISRPSDPARDSFSPGRRIRRRRAPLGGEDEVGAWHRGR